MNTTDLSSIVPVAVIAALAAIALAAGLASKRLRAAVVSRLPLEGELRMRRTRRYGEALAPVIAGTVSPGDSGNDEVHVKGSYQGRPVRLVIWSEFDSCRIEMMATRPLSGRGSFFLYWDASPPRRQSELDAEDAWDAHDKSNRKLFLAEAPHFYFKDDVFGLRALRARWDALPGPERRALAQILEVNGSPGTMFGVAGEVASLTLPASFTSSPEAPTLLAQYLPVLGALTRALEGG